MHQQKKLVSMDIKQQNSTDFKFKMSLSFKSNLMPYFSPVGY